MSLSSKIQSTIEETINLYIIEVSNKFNLDKNELLKLWDNKGEFNVNNTVTPLKEVKKDNDLLKLAKSELIEMCKAKALKVSGSKQDLVDRIREQWTSIYPGKKLQIHKNHPFEHQTGDTECGMYALFFIITLLTQNYEGKHHSMDELIKMFKSKRIPDDYVFNYRKIYFNSN